jgi:hypothetical protein
MTDMVADAYATMATFRTFLRVTATTDATDPDSALELLALEAAARAIDRACTRTFRVAGTAAARVYSASLERGAGGLSRWVADIDDTFTSAPTIALDATGLGAYTTATTAFRLGPANAAALGKPFVQVIFDRGTAIPYPELGVQVTAAWGWTTAAPTIIQTANLIQASRFMKRRDAPFGVAGSPEMGNELRLLAKLDPDVALMIGTLRRNWGAK